MSLPHDSVTPDPVEVARHVPRRSDLAELLVTAWPLIVINLAITGMQFVDGLMVAPLGGDALAAILPAYMIYLVPLVFGHGVLSVVNTFVAQHSGAGARTECGPVTAQGLWFSVAWGLILLLQLPLAPWYFRLLGHSAPVQALEVQYYQWCLLGGVPALVVVALSSFFTGLLRPKILVVTGLVATGLNIFFNWLFIFGNWGMPRMGVGGAALGTALATWCQALILLAWYWRRALRTEYGTGHVGLRPKLLGHIVRVGAPAGGMPVFDLLTWGVIVIALIGMFGTAHLAANSIVVRYLHLLFMPSFAIGTVLTALVGQAIGAKDPEKAQRRALLGFKLIAGYMVSVGVVFLVFREPLMRVFSTDETVIQAGKLIFICVAIYQMFDAAFLTYSHTLRGAGDTLFPALWMLGSGAVVLVGGSLVLVHWAPGLASLGPWIATTAHAIVLGVGMFARWQSGHWRKIRLMAQQPGAGH
jgi:MATE family multidrug resistance protein